MYLENAPSYTDLEERFAWEKTSMRETRRRKVSRPFAKAVSSAVARFRRRLLNRDKLMDLTNTYIEAGPVLDIGCGGGRTLRTLAESGYVPFGIEISKALASSARNIADPWGGAVVQSDATQGASTFGDAKFNGVLMSSFLEHEVNPAGLLRALHRVLKVGGYVVIKVPNYASVNRVLRGKQWCGFRFPDHVNYFTPSTLSSLVKSCGYSIVRCAFVDRLPTSDNMWLVARKVSTSDISR